MASGHSGLFGSHPSYTQHGSALLGGRTRLGSCYVEVMAEPREDPGEHPADPEGRSESGSNPDDAGSRESVSGSQTVAEQRTPIAGDITSARPPQREELVRVLSRVCEDPIEVNAVIEEIQGLSGEPLRVYIKSLERVLAARLELQSERLEIQGEKLDTQHEDLRAQGARLDAQGERLEKQGEAISSLGADVRAQSAEIRALKAILVEQIESLRREHRIVLGVLMLLATLGIFGWFTQSCSRRVEPNGGVGASQTIPEPREVTPSSPAAPPGPSAESLETDETAEVEGERPASDPDVTR